MLAKRLKAVVIRNEDLCAINVRGNIGECNLLYIMYAIYYFYLLYYAMMQHEEVILFDF